jgi:hypothetical protein
MLVIDAPEEVATFPRPAVFLGGAITGAPFWQQQAVDLLRPAFATCFNPRRVGGFLPPDHPHHLQHYREQVAWERGTCLGQRSQALLSVPSAAAHPPVIPLRRAACYTPCNNSKAGGVERTSAVVQKTG